MNPQLMSVTRMRRVVPLSRPVDSDISDNNCNGLLLKDFSIDVARTTALTFSADVSFVLCSVNFVVLIRVSGSSCITHSRPIKMWFQRGACVSCISPDEIYFVC